MNLIHLFVAFLLSTTVCANSEIPLGFFVKVGGLFKPLVIRPEPSQGKDFQMFSYNEYKDDRPPTEFNLYGRKATGTQKPWPGNVSISGDYFGVHRTANPTELKWNRNMKLKNGKFYSCSHSYHSYRFIMLKREFPLCYKVDLYLLPYDYEKKKVIPPVPPHLPMALFAKIGSDFNPLSSIDLGKDYEQSSLFTHNYPESPAVKIWYVDYMAHIFPSNHFVDWVGFYKGVFMAGPNIQRTRLRLNSEWKLLHAPFYSCALKPKMFNSVRAITNVVPDDSVPYCEEVELYLLPYRRIKGDEPVGTSTSIKYLYEEDYAKPKRNKAHSTRYGPLHYPAIEFEEERGEHDYDYDDYDHDDYDHDDY